MIFNQIKHKWQNNNIEITENILSSITGIAWHILAATHRHTQQSNIVIGDRGYSEVIHNNMNMIGKKHVSCSSS